MTMAMTTTKLYQTLSLDMATAIAKQLKEKPDSNLGLPTGASPLGAYQLLSQWSKENQLDWSQCRCFALDEYLEADLEETFAYYLQHNLYQNTNLPAKNKFNPAKNDNYDSLIESFGGLDLTILGIGRNGHIAFNEPGTPQHSFTHCTFLAESTRKANQTFFAEGEKVPKKAVTMGIETILNSKRIVLIASGKQKKEILEKALQGDIDINIPASFLSLHEHVTVLSDFEY
jgi:glucosamine-6-phosphate deaminase